MNDQHIKCFLAVAEHFSFTAAAKRLYLSQAAVSRNIAALERELGFPLFYRANNSVSLSPPGEIMLGAIGRVWGELDAAKARARKAMQLETGTLSIGFLSGQLLNNTVKLALDRFETRFPGVEVSMRRGSYRFLTDALRNNSIDLAETPLPFTQDMSEVEYMPVCRMDTLLIMPNGHRNIGIPCLRLIDFREDVFIVPSKNESSGAEERLRERCRLAGFEPKISLVPDIEAQMFSVERNKGVAIANPNHIMAKSPNVSYTIPADYPAEYFVLVWNKNNENRFVRCFRDIITETNPIKMPQG